MKREWIKSALTVGAITVLLLAGIMLAGHSIETSAQKSRDRGGAAAELDKTGTAGARVFYQLTDDENRVTDPAFGTVGLPFLYSNGSAARKVPATVSFDFHGRRGDDGGLVFSVNVERPAFLGGPFTKSAVRYDSGRDPGTIDLVQDADKYN